jgi:hypothetical protein
MAESMKAIEEYLREYTDYLHMVIYETYKHSKEEVGMLFEFIDNWIDLIPRERELLIAMSQSLPGIILLNSWKLTNWVSYEILCGKYFESIRNLRFIFEGSIYAVVIEDSIESKVWEKWQSLSTLSLKAEIFRLWEECKRKKVFDSEKKKVRITKIKKIVRRFVESANLPSKEKSNYIDVYVEILSQPVLYLPTKAMIQRYCHLLGVEDETRSLVSLWHELSRYQHFSYPYLEKAVESPDFVFLEVFDEKLFELSLELYFKTTDVFYAALIWRFPELRENVKGINEMWKRMFKRSFVLTSKILCRGSE